MAEIAQLILLSGRAAVELALFILLPIMIVMLSLLRVLEAKNLLDVIVRWATPILYPLGIPGLGIFALLQVLFVSFAAPLATLMLMNQNGTSRRHIAATLAMILSTAQANVTFPMAAFGLHSLTVLLVSLIAGLCSAAITYHIFARHLPDEPEPPTAATPPSHPTAEDVKGVLAAIQRAGREAFDLAIGALPMLVLALLLVNILKTTGVMAGLTLLIAPMMEALGYPAEAVLPIITKYIAGGTAMMGVVTEFIQQAVMSATDLNRLAGFMIHSFDIAGVAIFASAGMRVASVFRFAAYGAMVGIALRTVFHHFWF